MTHFEGMECACFGVCVFGSGTLSFLHNSLDNSELDPLKPLRASMNNDLHGEPVFLCNTDRWVQIPQDTLHSRRTSFTNYIQEKVSLKHKYLNRSSENCETWLITFDPLYKRHYRTTNSLVPTLLSTR